LPREPRARGFSRPRIRAFELGAQDYLAKPFDPSRLAESIGTVLDQIERGGRDAALAETLTALKAEQALATANRPD
jgi:DNA-binding response OmpR family regulator